MTISNYFMTSPEELITQFPLDGKERVVLSWPIGDLVVGDVLIWSAKQQFTNNNLKGTWVGVKIVLGASSSDVEAITLDSASGCNITETNSMHHYTATRSGSFTISKPQASACINFVVASEASWLAKTAILLVDANTGRISCAKFRG